MNSKTAKWGLSQLLAIFMVLAAGSAFAAGATLIHNSDNMGTKYGTWGVAGGLYGQFVCETCHNRTTNNVKRVADTVNGKPVIFNNMTAFGDDSVSRTTSFKVCEVCHTRTTYHQYNNNNPPQSGNLTHPNGDCTQCHTHAGAFRASCTDCHGHNAASANPITTGKHTAHINNLITLGANYSCADCHAPTVSSDTAFSNSANHNNGIVNYGGAKAGAFTSATQTCTSYCHTDGKGGAPAVAVAWNGAMALDCKGCHGAGGSFGEPAYTTGNSHAKHVSAAADCVNCHFATTANGTTIKAGGKHTDQFINVTSNAGLGYSTGAKTCSSASCHVNVYGSGSITTPVWGTTSGCSACHSVAITANGPATGSHTTVAGHAVACINCHAAGTTSTTKPSTGHADGNITIVNVGYPATVAKHAAGSGYSSCSAASCHANVYGTGYATTPVWGSTGNGCSACHSIAIGVNGPATGSHGGLHAGIACTSCHAAGTSATTVPSTGHNDGNITVVNVNYPATVAKHISGSGYSSCSNFYCHSNGTAATGPFAAKSAPTWGGSVNCVSCHGGGRGGAQFSSISSGRHLKHINSAYAYNYGCATCHAATVSNNTTILNPAKHVNQQVDVAFGGTAVTGGAAAVYATTGHAPGATGTVDQSCSNVYCHSNAQTGGQTGTNFYFRNLTGAKRFNQTAAVSLDCNSCHSTETVTSGKWTLSGAHLNHLNLTINSRIGKVLVCNDCHANGGTNLNRANHVDGLINYSGALSGNIARGNLKLSTGRCNTVYCHSNGQGIFNNMSTIAWFSGATLACNGCHGDAAGAASLSGKHNAHINGGAATGGMFGCVDCHASTVSSNTTLNTSGNHVNAMKNFSGAKAFKTGFVAGAGTCSTYCHTDGKGNAVVPPLWTSAATLDCSGCHGKDSATLTTGAHQKHLAFTGNGNTVTCANCHSATTTNGTTITGTTHIDGTVNIQQGGTFNSSAVTFAYAGAGTCNNISCHGGTGTTANFSAKATCDTCHPKSGLSGAHQVHMGALDLTSASIYYNMTANRTPATDDTVRKYGFGCASCHPMTTGNHINGTVDIDMNRVNVAGVGTLRFLNHSTAAYDKLGTKKCSNIYCHSNASRMESESNAKSNTSLAWTDSFAAHPELDRCAQCHGNQPTTGAHAAHSVGVHTFNAGSGSMIDGNIYNGVSGKVPITNKPNTAHGNPNNSTTIGCYICHYGTVTSSANDKNTRCVVCHYTGNPNGATLKGNASIANLKNHVNGLRDIQFNPIQVMSKAQVRPKGASKTNNSGFDFYSGVWTRTSYKSMSTLSYDKAKLALDTASMWRPGAAMASSCTNIACHNGKSVNWNLANFNDANKCMDCHNAL